MTTRSTKPTVKKIEEVVEEEQMSAVEKTQPTEMELLKAELAELRSLLGNTPQKQEEVQMERVQPNDYISVMSLIPHTLNISTKGGGQGNLKKFTKFGEVKKILYSDLVDIMEAHSNFLNAGYFYIMNPAVIRQHGLDEIYEKILTKEKIEEIVSTDSESCVEIYKTANPQQKEIIIELLVERLFNEPDAVNLNVVDRISRDSGVNLIEKAEDRRAIVRLKEEEEAEIK